MSAQPVTPGHEARARDPSTLRSTAMGAPSTVDEYIHTASEAARPMLIELRETIRVAAPQADERISYGMPSYHLHGRITYFQAHARHIGLYAFNSEDARAVGLEKHMAAKATLQFPLGRPLPVDAIHNLIQERVRMNQANGGETAARRH